MSKKDVVRATRSRSTATRCGSSSRRATTLAERPIALLVYARWSVRKPRVPARLDVGEVVRFELQRDDGGAGAANGVPVLYPGVRWNAGGWIEARVTAAGEHVVEAQILNGELDYGHAGPNAFHRARPLDTRVPMRVTGDSLLFALAAPTADDAPTEVSIVDRWAMRRVAAPMLVVQGADAELDRELAGVEGEVSAEVSLERRAMPPPGVCAACRQKPGGGGGPAPLVTRAALAKRAAGRRATSIAISVDAQQTQRGARGARGDALSLLELPADAPSLVLYQLPLAHDIAAVAPTCHAVFLLCVARTCGRRQVAAVLRRGRDARRPAR